MTVLVIEAGSATDVGLRRSVNEDSLLVGHPVYVVADGMGGHDAGDRASRAIVEVLAQLVGEPDLTPDDLTDALDEAQAAVRRIGDSTENSAGSTVTGAVVVEHGGRPHWLVFNVGDSRTYRWRDGQLTQLTIDHSVVQGLIDDGQLTREGASTFAGRNVITRAVGAADSSPDYWLHPVIDGETLLICSDGLTGEVTDATIATTLATYPAPQQAADHLLALALAAGARDNVTVVVAHVRSGGALASEVENTAVPDLDEDTVDLPNRGRR